MIFSLVLRGKFKKKKSLFLFCMSFPSSFCPFCPHGHFLPAVISRVEPSCNLIRISIEPSLFLRRPNGKSLRLTRKFHHHFSLECCLQHKTNIISPAASQWGQIMLSYLHAPLPPIAPNRPINTSETFSRWCLRDICCLRQLLHHTGWASRCTRLIEANSLTHFRGKGGRWGGRGGWSGIGQVLYCFCLMSCTMHQSKWKQVIYCCKNCLWQRDALLLTDSVGAFNRRLNKTQILSCGAE